jgi:hypothetical protein
LLGDDWICCSCDWLDVTDRRVKLLSPQERGTADEADIRLQD